MAKSSSSSHRKKRDKISSKTRAKKRSKSKSKSEKYKSKKLHCRDDSVSYSAEDDSRSLRSDSSVSSEHDRRSRRARSRTRRDAKGVKKRTCKRSYSSDSSEDLPPPRRKKRKVSKKDRECEPKKRNRSRKKKNARASSVSSESQSCSSCDRSEPRTRNRKREDIDRDKVEIGTGKSAYRSRSRSLCSKSDCQSDEKVTGESNGRRLRSVIAVVKGSNEGRWLDVDGYKEQITYENDDYPSCRSNDSNDGGNKRGLDSYLHVLSEERTRVESAKEDDARIMDLANSGNVVDKDGKGVVEGTNSNHDRTRETDDGNVNEVCAEVSSLKDDDLETILRQKALENLKRFKGKHQTVAVTGNSQDKKQASTAKAEMVHLKSLKVDSSRVEVEKSSNEDVTQINDGTQLIEETNVPPVDSICSSEILEIELDKNNVASEVVSAKRVVCSTRQVAGAGDSEQVTSTAVVDKPNLAAPEVTSERALASEELPQVTGSSLDKGFSGTAQIVTQSNDNNGENMSNDSGSTAPEPSRENRSDKQQDEANDGSQFEQKTMSVMRGSEMVQVSYKVYIPKRAPALARRQLKR